MESKKRTLQKVENKSTKSRQKTPKDEQSTKHCSTLKTRLSNTTPPKKPGSSHSC